MSRSKEIDSTKVIREAMINRRDVALKNNNFIDSVLFTHVIAALAYCIELEEKNEPTNTNRMS
jgi:hypothetical protein